MENYGPEIREQATALVSRSLGWLTDSAVERLSRRNANARQIIYAAAEILIAAQRAGEPMPNYGVDKRAWDDLLREALVQAEWTPKKYGRLPKSTRGAVEAAIALLTWRDHLTPPEPDPDGPEGSRAAAPKAAPEDGNTPSDEALAESVTAVLRQYRYNARALTGDAAVDWAKVQIASEANRLVPTNATDEVWHRVHNEIGRRFKRFVIHLDDSEPLPDGEYEVRIRGWGDNWVPARIEREGRTWNLPIGRVSAANINNMVDAVRPAA